jgi:hypothetical protein
MQIHKTPYHTTKRFSAGFGRFSNTPGVSAQKPFADVGIGYPLAGDDFPPLGVRIGNSLFKG